MVYDIFSFQFISCWYVYHVFVKKIYKILVKLI